MFVSICSHVEELVLVRSNMEISFLHKQAVLHRQCESGHMHLGTACSVHTVYHYKAKCCDMSDMQQQC